MTSAGSVLKLRGKRAITRKTIKSNKENIAKAHRATRYKDYGEEMLINRMRIGDFTESPCGCLVKMVKPHHNTYTIKPLCVYDNNKCEVLAEDIPLNSSIGNVEMKLDGSWLSRTPGYKQHLIGTQIYLPDDIVGIRMDPQVLLEEWREEWRNESKIQGS